jgi:hypothetical protein
VQDDTVPVEPVNPTGYILRCPEEDGSTLEIRTTFKWGLIGDDLIRNDRFGSFRRNGGIWVFSGSYDDPAWVALWRSRYFVDQSLPVLLGSVERLITFHMVGHVGRRSRKRILVIVAGLLSAGALFGWFAATRPLF